ncbi:hypothetical protein [Eggerthella sinensis]|uniref:YhgE/Pip domain-containing protein n=1 Tax=Eggerthella sinensis TaxID=242230 RepID=A0A3N0IV89_9ACTN|nr:hypothetical protein [Eggerthella sinensis]RDB70087.1 hypothetical protein C1876_04635 [Eggerthella sinensis]RNM40911.1 hypothetical protein DMP09_12190 [Eggerthella sinensis]
MMNLSARIRTVSLASLLAVALAVGSAPSAFAASSSTATYQKSEVVYASLSAAGAPEAVYVVNRFDVEKPGTVVDHGDYTKVQNLTNETELARQGDATTFEVEEGTLYYQGDAASTTLPWDVALVYELDGKKVKAEDLAGASGNLSIHVTTKQNASVDPAFYDSFMMQITFTLPGDVASDVAAEGATLASAGEDTTVAFTVLPGHDGDFTLTAKVQNFKMAGAQFAALPYSSIIEMPDTDQMVSGMTNLSDAVSALADGTASLASGVDELTSGAQSLSSGASAFGQGLNQLSGSSSTLVNASGEIKGALAAIAGGLQNTDLSQLDQLAQLPAGLNQLADGLSELRTKSIAARQGYADSLTALDNAIAKIPEGTLTENEIGKMMNALSDADDLKTAQQLVANYQAAQTVKGTYAATKPAFDGANQLLYAIAADDGALAQQEAALRSMAASLDSAVGGGQLDQLTQLASGLGELSGQYGQFHDGLAQYASGLSSLASNYNQLASGTADLAQGTGQLASGAGELSSGMGQLNASTITLPETMKEQIAEMTADYDFPAFDPVSFVSSDNANVQAVQFVMTTAAIEQPEAPQEEAPEEELTIWDRFVALFR